MAERTQGDVAPAPWTVDGFRVTVFADAQPAGRPAQHWEELRRAAPETANASPRAHTYLAEGPFGKGRLFLQEQPGRNDFLYSAVQNTEAQPSTWTLGALPTVTGDGVPEAKRWLALLGVPIKRLAFGAVLRLPVAEREEGYRKLGSYLHALDIDPDGSSDLLYQINRPRRSRVLTSVDLNRLSKWSVSLRSTRLITSEMTQAPPEIIDRFISLELDINTVPTFPGPISAAEAVAMLDEEVNLGVEISAKGDVP